MGYLIDSRSICIDIQVAIPLKIFLIHYLILNTKWERAEGYRELPMPYRDEKTEIKPGALF